MGCVGLGNQPERLATSLAAPMEPWMSLMEEAEIWESGSSPDNMPCSSEHGASEQEEKSESVLNIQEAHSGKTCLIVLSD